MRQFLLFAAAAALGQTAWAQAPMEPSFGGQPLKAWLLKIPDDTTAGDPKALEAVRTIGTNALPWLLTELQVSDSPTSSSSKAKRGVELAFDRNLRAVKALKVLGPIAAPAVPELTKIVMQGVADGGPQEYVLEVLPYLGDAAIPVYQAMLKSKYPRKRGMAAHKLGYFGPAAAPAIPDLLIALKDPAPSVQCAAAGAFGPIRSHADQVVPLLIEEYKTAGPRFAELAQPIYVKRRASSSVRRRFPYFRSRLSSWTRTYNPNAPGMPVPHLTMEYRLRLAFSLGHYGPKASEALPILEEEWRQLATGVHREAAQWNRKAEFEKVLKKAVDQIRQGQINTSSAP